MKIKSLMLVLAASGPALLVAGCADPPTAEDMNASYERALERTAVAAIELPGGEEGARQGLAGAAQLFSDMTDAGIRSRVAAVYAPGAYLNDNLRIVEGAAAIGEYFVETAGRVRSLQVEFLGVTHSGPDYFARWRMTVQSTGLNGGAPMVSYGVSHLRFDAGGRILVHRDFWDAGTGLYEYVPGLRSVIRSVRAKAAGD